MKNLLFITAILFIMNSNAQTHPDPQLEYRIDLIDQKTTNYQRVHIEIHSKKYPDLYIGRHTIQSDSLFNKVKMLAEKHATQSYSYQPEWSIKNLDSTYIRVMIIGVNSLEKFENKSNFISEKFTPNEYQDFKEIISDYKKIHYTETMKRLSISKDSAVQVLKKSYDYTFGGMASQNMNLIFSPNLEAIYRINQEKNADKIYKNIVTDASARLTARIWAITALYVLKDKECDKYTTLLNKYITQNTNNNKPTQFDWDCFNCVNTSYGCEGMTYSKQSDLLKFVTKEALIAKALQINKVINDGIAEINLYKKL